MRIASSTFVKRVTAGGRRRRLKSPSLRGQPRHPTMNSFAPSWNSKQSLRFWHNDNDECDDEKDEEDEMGHGRCIVRYGCL